MVKVAGVQMISENGDVTKNRWKAVQFIREAADNGAKLICLPELWVTGYGMSTEEFQSLAERTEGETISLFRELAKELSVVLIVPFPELAVNSSSLQNMIYISAAIIDSNGSLLGIYRKSMLWGAEQQTFFPGERKYKVYETDIGKIGVLLCYDIEFPEPARMLALDGAELLVVPSVWSNKAEQRWDIQLPARALDNFVYVLGVNTVGDGACGKTKFVEPNGMVEEEASNEDECIIYGVVDRTKLLQVREEIPYLQDYPHEFRPIGMKQEVEKIKGA
ncbi:nitrilase-related carbon-nitrogen hydrolase [Evansella sp. AB-rgal1]|uniref:nitrilase-related carbon-nitrogen hydrolase n=1 Tax=Evansella sp. AB-rgal1 TaxID=3242696 RepID=UPI00359D7FEC